MWRPLPFVLAFLLPLAAHAQEEGEEEEVGWGGETGVMGGPLDLSHLGKKPAPPPEPEPRFESWPKFGLRETQFHLVPAGSARGPWERERYGLTSPAWPGPAMLEDWDLASAYAFPRLAPSIGVEFFSFVGERQTDDAALFNERVRIDLYFLELRMNAVGSVGGERVDRTDLELDFRIPVRLGAKHRLALLPGATFPVDGRPKTAENTAVRFQAIYGIGGGGFGLQTRLGFIQGRRLRGLLLVDEANQEPALLYGALLAWRLVPGIQLRAEGSGEWAREEGRDQLTLMAGPVFFPFGDPRLSLGTLGIVETTGEDLDFERPAWGAVFQIGVDFL